MRPAEGCWYDACRSYEINMRTARIAITLDRNLLARLDELVQARRFPSRSQVLQEALREKLHRLDRERLARECAKLDPAFEQNLAEEGVIDQGSTRTRGRAERHSTSRCRTTTR